MDKFLPWEPYLLNGTHYDKFGKQELSSMVQIEILGKPSWSVNGVGNFHFQHNGRNKYKEDLF